MLIRHRLDCACRTINGRFSIAAKSPRGNSGTRYIITEDLHRESPLRLIWLRSWLEIISFHLVQTDLFSVCFTYACVLVYMLQTYNIINFLTVLRAQWSLSEITEPQVMGMSWYCSLSFFCDYQLLLAVPRHPDVPRFWYFPGLPVLFKRAH